jgi:hypothetical protein
MEVMPQLFNFEACGVLFRDQETKQLFMMQFLPEELTNTDDPDQIIANEVKLVDNIVRYPTDIGITGKAIKEKELVYFNYGDKKSEYVGEIDNCMSMSTVDSMLIGPIYDKHGELKGVI